VGEHVTVGITSGAMLSEKIYKLSLQEYEERAKNIFLAFPSVNHYRLKDIYGPTLTDVSIDAICVTEDTLQGAISINQRRKELGMKPLSIVEVPFEYDECGEKISSERIRQGIINGEGKRYDKLLFSKEQHILPELLREALRMPMGHTILNFSSLTKRDKEEMQRIISKHGYFYCIAVGDRVTDELLKLKIGPFISIIDGFTQRKALDQKIFYSILEKGHYKALNRGGTIQKGACKEIQNIFVSRHQEAIKQLVITGEEDLLTLVVVLLAPLEARVWYGQRGVGAIEVRITEKMKETVYNLLRQFK